MHISILYTVVYRFLGITNNGKIAMLIGINKNENKSYLLFIGANNANKYDMIIIYKK